MNLSSEKQKKQVVIDSSSAILLFKADLFTKLLNLYDTSVTESVYQELTKEGYAGSNEFVKFHQQNKFHIHPLIVNSKDKIPNQSTLEKLNLGERDTILYFLKGESDFIIIDDGKGAKYCMKERLPFISAILFPKILHIHGKINQATFQIKTDEIIQTGRYSQKIIDIAEKCSEQDLSPFFP